MLLNAMAATICGEQIRFRDLETMRNEPEISDQSLGG
jgi:hypothetical protein